MTTEQAPGTTPFCFATIVVDRAIESLLASHAQAQIKDEHPWLLAQAWFNTAQAAGLGVPLLLAKQGGDSAAAGEASSRKVHECEFSHWAFIQAIDVLELSGKRFMTTVQLGALSEVSPLFTVLDCVCVKPSDEQLLREAEESVRTQRVALTEQYLRPYAICETPGFIPRLTPWLYR